MDIFSSIVAPIIVGIVLALFEHWLDIETTIISSR
ncbi:type I toxin-antitoxin system Fst family toxin [Lactobacillus helveticus]|nr:type I toxin-antitoxin system Fst family toxin [Lactobacillus helveticus]